jgi:hypothetical protein
VAALRLRGSSASATRDARPGQCAARVAAPGDPRGGSRVVGRHRVRAEGELGGGTLMARRRSSSGTAGWPGHARTRPWPFIGGVPSALN